MRQTVLTQGRYPDENHLSIERATRRAGKTVENAAVRGDARTAAVKYSLSLSISSEGRQCLLAA